MYCFVVSLKFHLNVYCFVFVAVAHLNECFVVSPVFFENSSAYNKHFITRVPRLYGLYPLVKVFLSLSRSAPSFEKHLTREYNPYALGNRVIIHTYSLLIPFTQTCNKSLMQ